MPSSLLEVRKKIFIPDIPFSNFEIHNASYSNLKLNENYGLQAQSPSTMNSRRVLLHQKKLNINDDVFRYNNDKKYLEVGWNRSKQIDRILYHTKTNNQEKKNTSINYSEKSSNSSTLSLHILAYENAITDAKKPFDDSDNELKKRTLSYVEKVNKLNFLTKSSGIIENSFEFPRQQSNKRSEPELMKYQASQKLLTPRQSDRLKSKPVDHYDLTISFQRQEAGSKGGNNRTANIERKKSRKSAALEAMKKGKEAKKQKIQETTIESQMTKETLPTVFKTYRSRSCSYIEALRKEEEAKKVKETWKTEFQHQIKDYEHISSKLFQTTDKLNKAKLSIDELTKTQRKLTARLNRRSAAISRKPYLKLTTDAKADAAKRFKDRMKELYPTYTDDDIQALFKKAYAESEVEQKQMSEAATIAFERDTKLTSGGMDNARKLLKQCVNIDPFAPRKKVAAFRKKIQEQCPLKSFKLDNGVVGAKIENPGEAITTRFKMQMESGQYIPKEREKAPMCLVADGGGDHTVIGVIFGSIEKRHNPDAFLVLGVLKGGESRENFDGAFSDIADLLGQLNTITVNDIDIELDWFLTGDIKLLKILLGLRQGNAKNPCVVCVEPAEKSFKFISDEIHAYRNYNELDPNVCQDNLPFFNFIDFDHIVPPGLHQFLGIVDKLLKTLALELRRLEMIESGNEISELLKNSEEEDDEKLQKLIKELNDAETLATEWNNYYQSIAAEDTVSNIIENNFGEEEDERDEGCCQASNCIVKKTGAPLPQRLAKVAEAFKCKLTKKYFHSICVGLDTLGAKSQKKRSFEGTEVSNDVILQTIKNEATEATTKFNLLKCKLETDYCNMLVPENSSCYVKVMEKLFESFGASKQAYYQTYNGVHTRRILKRATEIIDRLIDPKTGKQITSQKVKACCKALEILSKIQDHSVARYLDEEEIKDLKDNILQLKDHMKSELPDVNVTHKFHWLIKHVPSFVEKWNTFNFFSEQVVEHYHHVIKTWLRRICTRDDEEQCLTILKWAWERNVIHDQYKQINSPNYVSRSRADNEYI